MTSPDTPGTGILLATLADIFTEGDPPPVAVYRAARGSIWWRSILRHVDAVVSDESASKRRSDAEGIAPGANEVG